MQYTNKNFPALKNDRLLRAARGDEVDKVPVWVMRQAGRYLPEFQAVRAKHDFFTVCRTPELACEVTLQPLRRYEHLDASIIFSDILVIPQALGMTVEMHPGLGPVFPEPLKDPKEINNLQEDGAVSRLTYVGDAITLTRHKIEGKVPLIGFTGAPFTLMGYMIEGGGSKTMSKTKEWLEKYPKDIHKLLSLLTRVIIDYLVMQAESGAQLLQVFESSADHLTREQFMEFSAPYLKEIRSGVTQKLNNNKLEQVPMTVFAKGGGHSLDIQATLGYETIGLDWTVDPIEARKIIGANITLQGNLDPQDLYKSPEEIRTLTKQMVQNFGKHRYIANLGHGITPQTPLESMTAFTEAVHEAL
ncbi:uroporphyrinogen decarboxylase isoform X2 [Aricia agestis]|uniref:uroporphyrinogen decarboxylase isoform X1 n=1 Tax=Aricia agestis TaxID=91739 RepID=UPI001C205CDB|nr:uroporphyrinogen decarboxylase isoform X1 [Aricia agestis]XP_041973550.1 uroporphyrinogen decarboxylase isoform X2 [Aricia agestis]